MGINGTLCRTPPNAEDFEQGAHIRALLLQAIAQTALTLTALKSEDLEGTAKMKVAAQISTPQVIPRFTSHRNRLGHAPDW